MLITVFDKSFLQSLNADEAVWFDHFFYPVITPIFMAETLADLEKKPHRNNSAESEVAIIASKTPEMNGGPCYFHMTLAYNDLLGRKVPMNGRIPIALARRVAQDGKVGAVIEEPPELRALYRWQQGRFDEVERLFAKKWREQVARIDLAAIEAAVRKSGLNSKICKNGEQALRYADEVLAAANVSSSRFQSFLSILDIPPQGVRMIKHRWNQMGRPPITTFAPYAAHVLRVELFFQICVGANIIASTRASHQIDITYLAYLPFCNVFVSSDKLHKSFVSLFLRKDQSFAWGIDVKAGLSNINEYYKSLPNEVKSSGIYRFARSIPDACTGVTRELFEKHAPGMLVEPPALNLSSEGASKLVQKLKVWDSAPETDQFNDDREIESLLIKRRVQGQRGSWIQVSEKDR